MDEKYANEDFLVRWMAGELSREELEGFQASDVHRQLMLIDRATEAFSAPEIDVEKALTRVTEINANAQKGTTVRKLRWLPALAASVALFFGAYYYFLGTKTYKTGIGEKEVVLLADGTTVQLNANSTLSLKRFGWEEDRVVDFEGEGFFSVTSGEDFTVRTNRGNITVLGTKFNVRNRKNLKVQCFEGTIAFTPTDPKGPKTKLQKGMGFEITESGILESQFTTDLPDWTEGHSSFTERPFGEVLEELTFQYPITFETDAINTDRLFTGRFTHNHLENALKTTLEPMGIKYHISEDKRIITLSN